MKYHHMYQGLIILLLFFNLSWGYNFDNRDQANQQDIEKYEPVIGIFAQPSEDIDSHYPANQGYSYIASSYVKWVESAGGRVVPIPYNIDDKTLYYLLDRINGFLIPGGDASLWVNETTHTGFSNQTITGQKIFKKIMEFNKKGDFPLWATCMGYEMVMLIVSGDPKVLDNFNSTNHSLNTKIVNLDNSEIYKNIPRDLHEAVQKEKAFYYNHRYGIELYHLQSSEILNSKYRLTSWSKSNGKGFVATLEGYGKYRNQYLSQYHPEKNQYEWQPIINSNHGARAIQASQYEAYMFVNKARKNKNRFDSFEDFKKYSIINYSAVSCLDWEGSHFISVYVFQANKQKQQQDKIEI